jgi:hypothetical protein
MSEHERRKSADASASGNDAHEQRGPAGSDGRRRGVELEEEEERALGSEAREAGSERRDAPDEARRPAEPGGGRASQSEKPDSPDSRWGGGR